MKIDLKIIDKRIGTEFPIPDYAKEGDAAVDLRAMIDEPIELFPGDSMIISTGVAINMNTPDIMAMIVPRSGLGTQGLVLSNGTGIIDSGYTGEIKLTPLNRNKVRYKYSWKNKRIFENKTNAVPIIIEPGDRIAQMIFVPIIRAKFNIVEELSETDRGENGFGSSGKNKVITSEDSIDEEIVLAIHGDIKQGEKFEDLVKGDANE